MIKKNILKMLFLIFFILVIGSTVSNAAISASNKTVNSGESVSISIISNVPVVSYKVTMNGNGGLTFVTSSGGTGAGSATITDAKATGMTSLATYTFKAPTVTKDTTYTVSFTATAMEDEDFNAVANSTATATITVKAPEPPKQEEPKTETPTVENKPTTGGNTNSGGSSNSSTTTKPKQETPKQEVVKSSNSKLDSLQIAEGAITPDFSSSVKEYSITIPNEITKLSISAIADHSKATVRITGNEDLQVGENEINVTVTAEDGSKTTYTILAKRALPELSLQSLAVSYLDGNGVKKELALEPVFSFDIYDYEIKEVLPHTIKELEILAGANRENAKIDILGNKELKTGKNEITVRISVINDAGLEEQKTYKISVKKEEPPVVIEPSTIGKVKTWFSGIGSTISKFISENLNKITTAMLIVATVAFMGLTVYFVYDYKKYNELLAKLAEHNKENLMGRVNVALDPEKAKTEIEEEQNNLLEELFKEEENISKAKIKKGKGKRFKV